MSLPTWDLVITLFFLTTMAFGFILGRGRIAVILIITYAAYVISAEGGALVYSFFTGTQSIADSIWISNNMSIFAVKAILFGSNAYGNSGQYSDIDILVVLDKEGIPRSYREKSMNYLEISRLLRKINKKIPMDIMVMTRTEWERFVEMKSGFSREIIEKGIDLV